MPKAQTGGTMQAAMCRSVAEYFRERRFLWSLPRSGDGAVRDNFWRGKDGAFLPRLRLPGRSFGLNQWRECHDLALLSVINLSPSQFQLLDLLGVSPDEVFTCLSSMILGQDLLRSSLRDPLATAPVECIVPCLPSSMAIEALLPGCTVEIMPNELIPRVAEPAKRGRPATGRTPEAERQRRSRAARRLAEQRAKERERERA